MLLFTLFSLNHQKAIAKKKRNFGLGLHNLSLVTYYRFTNKFLGCLYDVSEYSDDCTHPILFLYSQYQNKRLIKNNKRFRRNKVI